MSQMYKALVQWNRQHFLLVIVIVNKLNTTTFGIIEHNEYMTPNHLIPFLFLGQKQE